MGQPESGRRLIDTFTTRLGEPVDIASIALFRFCFGIVLFSDIWLHFSKGWIGPIYVTPAFHFKYLGFGWVHPLPGGGMYIVFALLGISAVGIALGLFYRACCLAYGMLFTYVFLLEEVRYLNHYYLVILLCFLLAAVPAHRAYSIDSLIRPKLRRQTVPKWSLWLLRFQIGVVYFYAGLAKLKFDWLDGRPALFMWLRATLEHEWIGVLNPEWMAYFLSYGGLLLDLLIIPLLLWRRTRGYAFAGALFFHVFNKFLFSIGIFPFLMTGATALYFEPDWPRRLVGRFRVQARRGKKPVESTSKNPDGPPERVPGWWRKALVVYVVIQLIVPLRHHLYPGSVLWTEEGQYFAWHMLARAKDVKAVFWIVEPETGRQQRIDPARFLPAWQASVFAKRPDMCVQFARYLEGELKELGYSGQEIRGDVRVSLNGRPFEHLIDPSLDLTQVKRTFLPKPWILPQKEPLPSMKDALAKSRAEIKMKRGM